MAIGRTFDEEPYFPEFALYRESPRPINSRRFNFAVIPRFFLLEVAVQQALEGLAVAGFVAGHDQVMSIENPHENESLHSSFYENSAFR